MFLLDPKDWDDDAERNASRSGIFSYHIHTITILFPAGNGDISKNNFPIGLSKKGKDHNILMKVIREEMDALTSRPHLFYDGREKKFRNVIFQYLGGVRDRPALSEHIWVGNHNSLWGKRPKFCQLHSDNIKLLPCDKCHSRRMKKVRGIAYVDSKPCTHCADLDYSRQGILKASIQEENSRTSFGFRYPKSVAPGSPDPPKERPELVFETGNPSQY